MLAAGSNPASHYLIISSVVVRQPRGLSFAARNVTEVFFILCSREQSAFSLDASTVLRR